MARFASHEVAVAAAICGFAYFVLLGGTPPGELLPWVRTISGVIGAGLIALYFWRAPREADHVDRWVLLGVVLFALAALLSQYPRQSLDAVLTVVALAGALYAARGLLAADRARRWAIATMRGLFLVLTILTLWLWLPHLTTWFALGDGLLPPLGMSYPGSIWGHRYDLTLLLALLYPAWWAGGENNRHTVIAIVLGVITVALVILGGSRTLWLALGVSTVITVAPHVYRMTSGRLKVVAAILALGTIAAALFSGAGRVLLDRLLATDTLFYRADMWAILTRAWLEHPLAGFGPGSFPWILQLTPYFETNSWAPRHPDSMLFQLLPEVGLLGLAAAAAVGWATIPSIIRCRSRAAQWALVAFIAAGIGTSQTDFLFLVVVALAWLAYAVPRQLGAVVKPSRNQRPVGFRVVRAAGLLVVGLAFTATSVSTHQYAEARAAVQRGDLDTAARHLDTAVALDPGMALYWRQRGTIRYVQDDPRMLSDLRIAADLNPSDDLTWRVTALVHDRFGDEAAAEQAVNRAVQIQRSDPANVLLGVALMPGDGGSHGSTELLSEIVQAWPQILGAVGWREFLPAGASSADLVDRAARRWEDGLPSPEPEGGQILWLASLSNENASAAAEKAGDTISILLAGASIAVLRCEKNARQSLDLIPSSDRRSSSYWGLRLRDAANHGATDHTASVMLDLVSASRTDEDDALLSLNPINENSRFSTDAWGYRRLSISWPVVSMELPSPVAGSVRWTFFPDEAIMEAGMETKLPDCVRPQR